jgi:L-ribulose-5-phosphate 3-epimerase UlaE
VNIRSSRTRLTLNTEECLVDFIEMHSEHSGENMANLVWDSLEQLGIVTQVSL